MATAITTKPPQLISVYFLQFANRSYIGYTVNLTRRLRQHSGKITGGAKYTKKWNGDVSLVAHVSGFTSKNVAMSYEWHAKRPCRTSPNTRLGDGSHVRLYNFFKPLLSKKFGGIKDDLTVHLHKHHCLKPTIEDTFRVRVETTNPSNSTNK